MIIKYTVGEFIKDNIDLYLEVKYYVENYREIFISRAKKIYPHTTKQWFSTNHKSDHDFYVEYINDEEALGDNQIGFQWDRIEVYGFCGSIKHLIDYSDIRYETSDKGVNITYVGNHEFYDSVVEIEKQDLSNIKVAKEFIENYFN